MRKSELNYPYPILNEYSNDYSEECHFDIKVENDSDINSDLTYFTFNISLDLISDGLNKLLDEQKAKMVLRYDCVKTMLRVSEILDSKEFELKICKNDVAEKIELTAFVVAITDIDEFLFPEHVVADLFDGISPSVKAGEILAESETVQVYIDDSELQKLLASIVVVDSVPGIKVLNAKYDTDDGLIHIQMPKEEHKDYGELKERYKYYGISRFLQCGIIMPTIIEAIELLRREQIIRDEYDAEYEPIYDNTIWAETLLRVADEKSLDLFDPYCSSYSIANEILGVVTKDAISDLAQNAQKMYSNEGESRIGGVD